MRFPASEGRCEIEASGCWRKRGKELVMTATSGKEGKADQSRNQQQRRLRWRQYQRSSGVVAFVGWRDKGGCFGRCKRGSQGEGFDASS